MANYNSSLTGAQIEAVLTGARAVNGILKGNGSGTFSAATAGTDYGYPLIMAAGAPTTLTAGTVGQLFLNTENCKLYVCTAVSGSSYTWSAVTTN